MMTIPKKRRQKQNRQQQQQQQRSSSPPSQPLLRRHRLLSPRQQHQRYRFSMLRVIAFIILLSTNRKYVIVKCFFTNNRNYINNNGVLRRHNNNNNIIQYNKDGRPISNFIKTITTTTTTSKPTTTALPYVPPNHYNDDHHHRHLWQRWRHNIATRRQRRKRRSQSPPLSMVLTTPESIIEQASTEKLLDDLIDESVRMSARRPIMLQFKPTSLWLWSQWKGTVFAESWTSCVRNMIFASLITLLFKTQPHLSKYLVGFNVLWGQLLSVTTFTLTFFLNVSYALWRKCIELSRRLQGRLLDLNMSLAAHAARTPSGVPGSTASGGSYTPAALSILTITGRYIRLFNLLTYASFTRSHRPILTPSGLRRLVDRGLLTPRERQILVEADVPATQRHNCIVVWILRLFIEARMAGHVIGGDGFEMQFLEKVHVIRAQYGAIGDELQGRMPLAYAHIVQVLVDVVLWMYPIMAYTSGFSPWLVVLGTGLLTIFYQGLFDLAKRFLDPYDNENYGKGDDPLSVDTLVAESNAGSVRWMEGGMRIPIPSDKVREGELFEYILPLGGYSVEELMEREEEERKRLELEEMKKKKREEEKRQREREMAEMVDKIMEQPAEDMATVAKQQQQQPTPKKDQEKQQQQQQQPMPKKDQEKQQQQQQISPTPLQNSPLFSQPADKKSDLLPTATQPDNNIVPAASPAISYDFKVKETLTLPPESNKQDDDKEIEADVNQHDSDGTDDDDDEIDDTTDDDDDTKMDEFQFLPEPNEMEPEGIVNSILTPQQKNTFFEAKTPKDAETTTPNTAKKVVDGVVHGDTSQKESPSLSSDDTSPTAPLPTPVPKSTPPPIKPLTFKISPSHLSSLSNDDDSLWYDEIGPDGSEIRLSELLADEYDYDESSATPTATPPKITTFEEFTAKASKIIKDKEDELKETEAILKAGPGSDWVLSEEEEERRAFKKKEEEKKARLEERGSWMSMAADAEQREKGWYDQTKLDGLSQLWGARPEDVDLGGATTTTTTTTTTAGGGGGGNDGRRVLEEPNFGGISQLWYDGAGGDLGLTSSSGVVNGGMATTSGGGGDTTAGTSEPNYSYIQQLWNQANDYNDDIPQGPTLTSNDTTSSSLPPQSFTTTPPFTIDWFDEVDMDGNELRLSQMLADEIWDEEIPPSLEAPMTYDEFTKNQDQIFDELEKERLETEAILNAAPGADSLDLEVLEEMEERREREEEEERRREEREMEELEMDVVAEWEREEEGEEGGTRQSMVEQAMNLDVEAFEWGDISTTAMTNGTSDGDVDGRGGSDDDGVTVTPDIENDGLASVDDTLANDVNGDDNGEDNDEKTTPTSTLSNLFKTNTDDEKGTTDSNVTNDGEDSLQTFFNVSSSRSNDDDGEDDTE